MTFVDPRSTLGDTQWASDVLVSMPDAESPRLPVLRNFGGIGMTVYGWQHMLDEDTHEMLSLPYFRPGG